MARLLLYNGYLVLFILFEQMLILKKEVKSRSNGNLLNTFVQFSFRRKGSFELFRFLHNISHIIIGTFYYGLHKLFVQTEK